ncbi:MAG TPA: hypothetical protein VMY77_02015 [Chitinophagaceae bacterium]|nr:hypothetical protein [Chitinophagaceae bacterium]
MIKDLWDIGKEIFDMSDTLKKQDKDKRESLSKLLLHIGNVIKDTYHKLLNNVYPAGNCQQLEIFSEELFKLTTNILGETKARSLSNKLMQAHEVEKLLGEVQQGNVDKKELVLLDEASGNFIAASQLVLI